MGGGVVKIGRFKIKVSWVDLDRYRFLIGSSTYCITLIVLNSAGGYIAVRKWKLNVSKISLYARKTK